jgi:FkbM family methyltransferase
MSILLNILGDSPIDLSGSNSFLNYYNNKNSYSKHIIEREINNGHYNDPQFLKIFENKDAVVIDAGANIGLFSLYLNKVSKKIYAIEPTVEHIEVLQDLCRSNNLNNIELHDLAFNDYHGFCSFSIDDSNTTTNRISETGRLVRCTTILNFIKNVIKEPVIDLLKLDIEGGEVSAVLKDPTFEECKDICNNIYIEIHPPFSYPEQLAQKFINMGYQIKMMNSEFLNNNLNMLAFKNL